MHAPPAKRTRSFHRLLRWLRTGGLAGRRRPAPYDSDATFVIELAEPAYDALALARRPGEPHSALFLRLLEEMQEGVDDQRVD